MSLFEEFIENIIPIISRNLNDIKLKKNIIQKAIQLFITIDYDNPNLQLLGLFLNKLQINDKNDSISIALLMILKLDEFNEYLDESIQLCIDILRIASNNDLLIQIKCLLDILNNFSFNDNIYKNVIYLYNYKTFKK